MFKDKEWRLAFKFISMFFLFALCLWLVVRLAQIITILIIALLIVYSISPLVNFLVKKKIPPFAAAGIVSSLLLLFVFLVFYLIMPTFLAEIVQMRRYLTTDYQQGMEIIFHQLTQIDERFNLTLTESLTEFLQHLTEQLPYYLQTLLMRLTSLTVNIVSKAWAVLGLLFLIFYLVQDLERVKKRFTRLFPHIYHQKIGHIIAVIDQKVGAYIRGNIVRCSIVGLLTFIALSLIGMPFALMLGTVAGILNIIYYIGPVLAAIPAFLISLTPETPDPLPVIALYIVVQVIDAFLLTPLLLGKAVDLSPLTIIIVLLIGAQLLGILGVIVAIPVAATLKVLIFDYYLTAKEQA